MIQCRTCRNAVVFNAPWSSKNPRVRCAWGEWKDRVLSGKIPSVEYCLWYEDTRSDGEGGKNSGNE